MSSAATTKTTKTTKTTNTAAAASTAAASTAAAAVVLPLGQKIDLKGKVAIVTGASRGIGEAIVRRLASQGVKVVLAARSKEASEKIVADIKQAGGEATFISCDVSKLNDQKAVFDQATAKYGGVDLVFANAGTDGDFSQNIEDLSEADLSSLFNINVLGVSYSIKLAIPAFRARGGGSIVLVSSVAASINAFSYKNGIPRSGLGVYAATKAAVDMLGRTLTFYEKEGIRGYTICPGAFDTYMLRNGASKLGMEPTSFANFNPVKKDTIGNVEDLANVVTALFDNSTGYAPGSLVICDNDITYSAHEHYKTIELPEDRSIDKSKLFDATGLRTRAIPTVA